MSPFIAANVDGANTPRNVKHLSVGWMIGFLLSVSFVGLFSIVPLRKVRKERHFGNNDRINWLFSRQKIFNILPMNSLVK